MDKTSKKERLRDMMIESWNRAYDVQEQEDGTTLSRIELHRFVGLEDVWRLFYPDENWCNSVRVKMENNRLVRRNLI